jgi:hypothetical protein
MLCGNHPRRLIEQQQFQSPDQLGPALVYLDEALEGVQLEAEQQHRDQE